MGSKRKRVPLCESSVESPSFSLNEVERNHECALTLQGLGHALCTASHTGILSARWVTLKRPTVCASGENWRNVNPN